MSSPKVSVIIPVYNAAPWLQETIDSVLSQSWTNIELIVVDDGSTDISLEIVRRNGSARIKLLQQQNRGAAAARNAGLRVAGGEFIQFLDADDLLDSRKIEIQVERLLLSGAGCVANGPWTMFTDSHTGATVTPEPLWQDMSPVKWLRSLFLREGMMPIHAWLFPRRLLDQVGFWDERLTLNDDREFSCRAVAGASNVLFCQEAVCYYRRGISTSLSNAVSEEAWTSAFLAADLCVSALLNRDASGESRTAAATEYLGLIYSVYPEHHELRRHAEKCIENLQVDKVIPPFAGSFTGTISTLFGWKTALYVRSLINKLRT